jgi:hypothetical protein
MSRQNPLDHGGRISLSPELRHGPERSGGAVLRLDEERTVIGFMTFCGFAMELVDGLAQSA